MALREMRKCRKALGLPLKGLFDVHEGFQVHSTTARLPTTGRRWSRFQQMLIFADSQGVVDMTISAIARKTGIPMRFCKLGSPCLKLRRRVKDPEMDGRRIARLDAHRDWGWFLVNFAKYRKMQTREEKNEADRYAHEGNPQPGVARCRKV